MTELEHDKINNLLVAIARLETTLIDYESLVKRVAEHDKMISLQESICHHIREKRIRINWGTVFASIISMVIGTVITTLILKGLIR